jgi:hypothetical protein
VFVCDTRNDVRLVVTVATINIATESMCCDAMVILIPFLCVIDIE